MSVKELLKKAREWCVSEVVCPRKYGICKHDNENCPIYCIDQACRIIDQQQEIVDLAHDIHTRDPINVSDKWGVCGAFAEELLCEKIEALKGEPTNQAEKNKRAIKLLEEWFAEPDNMGEDFWREFRKELNKNRFTI